MNIHKFYRVSPEKINFLPYFIVGYIEQYIINQITHDET